LLWLTLAVACWFGGVRYGRWRAEQEKDLPMILGGSRVYPVGDLVILPPGQNDNSLRQ
jgi:hypothetical protein